MTTGDVLAVPSGRECLSALYVAEAFGGGLFEITRALSEGLVARGHRVAIAYGIRPETPSDLRAEIDDRVELVAMPWTDRSIAAQLRAVKALRNIVNDFNPDVVHLMSSFAGIHGAVALGRTVPTIYSPQGYSFTMGSKPIYKRAVFRGLEAFVSRRVSVIGACSNTEGAQARQGIRAPRVAIVENGIAELDRPVSRGSEGSGPTRVVALGRASPQRRPAACARILSAISDVASVEWIGGGPDREGTDALTQAGIPVTGWLPRADTQAQLARAKVYLHWTAWDGLPLSVLEALANDVVVVASDIGPNREILGPDQVCNTESEAISLIRAILLDASLYERLKTEQRARRGRYSAQRMVEGWIDLYRTMARDTRPDSVAAGTTSLSAVP